MSSRRAALLTRVSGSGRHGDAPPERRPGPARFLGTGMVLGAAALTVTACGGAGTPAASPTAGAASRTVHVNLVLQKDASSGPIGSFTGKAHWPRFVPSNVSVPAGSTVVLTIKNWDDASTALPAGSPYGAVQGGTETAGGKPVTSVSNDMIAHTVTIPGLGVNVPIPMAPKDGADTVVFTFTAGKAGTYTWACMTPCGGDPNGMGGAMATAGWMKGTFTVT